MIARLLRVANCVNFNRGITFTTPIPPVLKSTRIRAIEENPVYVVPVEQYEERSSPEPEESESAEPRRVTLKDIPPVTTTSL